MEQTRGHGRRWVAGAIAVGAAGALGMGACTSPPPPAGHVGTPDASITRRDAGPPIPGDAGLIVEDTAFPMSRDFGEALGPAVSAAEPPPPISGGTLLALHGGVDVAVSDPEGDRVLFVDTVRGVITGEVALSAHDEPGRLAEDAAGRVHVVLRRGGAVVTITRPTPDTAVLGARRAVCPVPRGIAYAADTDHLYVTCAGGELVELEAEGGVVEQRDLGADLRDVVVDGSRLWITRFRSAEVLEMTRDATTPVQSHRFPQRLSRSMHTMEPEVAWRAVPRVGGGVLVLHQRASVDAIDPSEPAAYGAGCAGNVESVVSALRAGEPESMSPALPCATLVVDAAASPDGEIVAVAVAGAAPSDARPVRLYATAQLLAGVVSDDSFLGNAYTGRAISVAYVSDALVVQTRDPAQVVVLRGPDRQIVALGGPSRTDTGLDLFHVDVGGGVACASCHPEGGDDGHVWSFVGIGGRRTIPLRGGLRDTAPYHWQGEFADMTSLLHDVFASRMSGGEMSEPYREALLTWADALPLEPAPAGDPEAVARGRALFESAEVGCTDCHSGPTGSNQSTVDVGTGGLFQVPALRGLAYHAPYLHDGRAATLAQRFEAMGGGDAHGHTSQLDAAQIDDLVQYLETL